MLWRLAVGLSLLLSAGASVMWVRSYQRCDVFVRQLRPEDRWCVTSEMGLVVIEHEAAVRYEVEPTWVYFHTTLPRRWPLQRGIGFNFYRSANRHYMRLAPTPLWGVTIPYWAIVVTGLLLPIHAIGNMVRTARRQRRTRTGLCTACGYDVRFSGALCSECGHPTA